MTCAPPRGPVALEVCQESRAIALKSYELAFAGKNLVPEDEPFLKEWQEGRYGDKRMWVDFRNDVVLFWHADEQEVQAGEPWKMRMDFIARHSSEEMAKIRRLALEGSWHGLVQFASVVGQLNTRMRSGGDTSSTRLRETVKRSAGLCKVLEQLFVLVRWERRFPVAMSGEEKENIRGKIEELLREDIEGILGRDGRMPEVIVMMDFQIYDGKYTTKGKKLINIDQLAGEF